MSAVLKFARFVKAVTSLQFSDIPTPTTPRSEQRTSPSPWPRLEQHPANGRSLSLPTTFAILRLH